jgi:hypothetical protein
MRNKVTLFVGDQELDMFGDEDITINLSVQNIQDISKVFTDYTQGFSVPASPRNNSIFEHYYRTDIVGGADYRLRAEGSIEINGLVFRYGSIELEGVQMRKNAPYAYDVTFYGLLVNLTDLFGEDYLYDLDLSAYNHTYDQATIHSGLTSSALAPVIYPLITPQDVWFYESDSMNGDPNNIHFHNVNQAHGVQYYDLKPALPVERIFDAIAAKYGVSFNITNIGDFEKLYMWCHRRAEYMYGPGVSLTLPWNLVTFNGTSTPAEFNTATETWTVTESNTYDVTITTDNATVDYEIGAFVNGQLVQAYVIDAHPSTTETRTFSIVLTLGDEVTFYTRAKEFNTLTLQVSLIEAYVGATLYMDATNSATQTINADVDVSSNMPEQKVADFVSSICKMFNLVVIPTSSTSFDLLPLGEWYASGATIDLSQYFDITESQVERPQLYKQIQFQYNETGAITGEQYRLTNNVGYGDLRAEFVFDTTEELMVEPQFDQMLFNILTDEDGGGLTDILAGYAVTRELQTYVGQPFLFYAPETYFIGDFPISFIDLSNIITGNNAVEVDTLWYCNSSSKPTNGATTYSTNFGADLDPYFLESVNNSLYNAYWKDYIVDLYDPSRRLVRIPAILPLGKILNFDLKNKLLWNGQRWIVNVATFNLTTGRAEFELLNDV